MLSRITLSVALFLLSFPVWGQAPAGAATFHTLAPALSYGTAYSPQDIQTAYDFQPLYDHGDDGTGQTIALIEVDTYSPADIQAFDQRYSLPDPKVSQFYAGGASFPLPNSGETTMDVEWAHALAPGAAIQIYYLNNKVSDKANWKSMAEVLRQAAANGAGTVSISLGTCGHDAGYGATKKALAALVKQGISVFVSSGDTGSRPGTTKECGSKLGVSYPASDPSVVAVGGTSLRTDDTGVIADETAWNKSGGGVDKKLLRAVWQMAPQIPADGKRWVPDVSFVGDPATGVAVMFKGAWHQAGGTSLGAPCWAAAWALMREDAAQSGEDLGAAPALIYKVANSTDYSQTFHDILRGTNGHYHAQPGWDPVTGWGTPNVASLTTALESEAGA